MPSVGVIRETIVPACRCRDRIALQSDSLGGFIPWSVSPCRRARIVCSILSLPFTFVSLPCGLGQMSVKLTSVKDVPADQFIAALAAHFKKTGKVCRQPLISPSCACL
jgi:hypothetical protein